jgi:kynurenine formamidase
MKPVDLTHPIAPDMPVYPGTEPPVFTAGCSIDEAGFQERKISMFSHTGTHVDAPAHLLKDHETLDMLAIDHFFGPALLVNFVDFPGRMIGMQDLAAYRQQLREVDFLLLHTGWSRYWGSGGYFTDFPVLSPEAAVWLSGLGLKGLGLDTISADAVDSPDFPVHKALLRKGMIIIENLTNLAALPEGRLLFSCFPLSFTDADGSPVRAVAFIQ